MRPNYVHRQSLSFRRIRITSINDILSDARPRFLYNTSELHPQFSHVNFTFISLMNKLIHLYNNTYYIFTYNDNLLNSKVYFPDIFVLINTNLVYKSKLYILLIRDSYFI
jgi:hypothetical protein